MRLVRLILVAGLCLSACSSSTDTSAGGPADVSAVDTATHLADAAADAVPADASTSGDSDRGDTAEAGLPDGVEVPTVFPEPEELAERIEVPPLFEHWPSREVVETRVGFESILVPTWKAVFAHYMYGRRPASPVVTTSASPAVLLDNPSGVSLTDVTIHVDATGGLTAPVSVHVSIFSPVGEGPFPTFIALNACGNQTLVEDAAVRQDPEVWVEPKCADAARGSRASLFPVAEIVGRGYALVAVHQSDIAPDDFARQDDALRAGVIPDETAPWGLIATWAYGLSAIVTGLSEVQIVDTERMAAVGHSRRGKAALLAAAWDERIAMAIPHQSGTCGASLSRHYLRDTGDTAESLGDITFWFAHWFTTRLGTFAGAEARLPFDQHQLLAMMAPRPLLVSDAAEDDWAGPLGARRAVELAEPAWALYGAGFNRDGAGDITLDGRLSWHLREGDHSLTAEDWTLFMDFSDRHL